jgi:4-amino-4-deoxy-L-arabinose transferase-like glycosyltransferase
MPVASAATPLAAAPPAAPAEPCPRGRPRVGLRTDEMVLVVLLVAAALALRLTHLGRLGLVADEGHQALAVEGILEHGAPLVPAGNIYLRGAPFTYAEAAAAALTRVDEWSLRLPAALFGTATALAIFVFGRMLFGTGVGLIAAFLVTFSVWELELSRYARMYTLLQLAFLISAIGFYRAYIEPPGAGVGRDDDRRTRNRLLTWFAMGLAAVTHQLGIFVLCLYAIPTFLPAGSLPHDLRGNGRWRLLVPVAGLGALWFAFHRLEAVLMIRGQTFMPGHGHAARGSYADQIPLVPLIRDHILVPELTMPLNLIAREPGIVLAAAGIALALAIPVMATFASRGRRLRVLWALAILGAAFMNLFAIAIGLLAAYLILLPGGGSELRRRPLLPAMVGILGFAVFWGIYLATHPVALAPGWGPPRTIADAFLGYPPVESRVLSWFLRGWPLLTIVVAVTLAILLILFARDRRRAPHLYAALLVLLPLLAVTMTRQIYNESRYHFHLYPFIIVVFALAIGTLARLAVDALDAGAALVGASFRIRRLAAGALAVTMSVLLSSDVVPSQIALVVGRDYSTPRDPIRAILNWQPYALFHQDHRSPAAIVRANLGPDDRVMVLGPTYLTSIYDHYIGRIDYAVSEKAEPLYRDGVVVHHVTRARCIMSRAELDEVLEAEGGRRTWILGDLTLLSPERSYLSPALKARLRAITTSLLYIGRDDDTFVGCYEPGGPR